MPSPSTFPYLATAIVKYKSPHKQDLSFAKGENIRVMSIAPKSTDQQDSDDDDDDDEDVWLVGESLDGSKKGTFPGGFVEPNQDQKDSQVATKDERQQQPSELGESSQHNISPASKPQPTQQVHDIPDAALETAKNSETEPAGFGAPLPPRPPSSDDQDVEEKHDKKEKEQEKTEQDIALQSPIADKPSSASSSEPTTQFKSESESAAVNPTPSQPVLSQTETAKVNPDESAQVSTAPAAKSPPPIATKPSGMSSSFRDRLAAFNKPAEAAPPPLPKSKPGGWKRPPPAPGIPKPIAPAIPPATSSTTSSAAIKKPDVLTSSTASEESEPAEAASSFSAADAQSSIKMSLKERMAALQQSEAARSEVEKPNQESRPKPTIPGRLAAEQRNVALQGMGLAPPPQPAQNPTTDSTKSDKDVSADAIQTESNEENASSSSESQTQPKEPHVQNTQDSDAPSDADDAPELTEEEKAAERRAAIAKRMAALGGRRLGGGPAIFGAPAPAPLVRTKTAASIETSSTELPLIATTEPLALSPSPSPSAEEPVDMPLSAQENKPATLAVPRRTAPPRRKKSSGSSGDNISAPQPPTSAQLESPVFVPQGDHRDTQAGEKDASPAEPSNVTSQEQSKVQAAAAAADQNPALMGNPKETDSACLSGSASEETDPASQNLNVTRPESFHHDLVEEGEDDEKRSISAVSASGYESQDARIKESERQLEEYLRSESMLDETSLHDSRQDDQSALGETEPEAQVVTRPEGAEKDQDENKTKEQGPELLYTKPPSRPPSTRPPLPGTFLSAGPATKDADDTSCIVRPKREGMVSPAFSQSSNRKSVPPVPKSPIPQPPRDRGAVSPAPPRSPPPPVPSTDPNTFGSLGTGDAELHEPVKSAPILAAPRPRMAVPAEYLEDEEILAVADAAQRTTDSAANQVSSKPEATTPEPPELTEEEQEAQRRAKIARRMAGIGGQRIGSLPGMVLPMPPRRVHSHVSANEDKGLSPTTEDAVVLSPLVQADEGEDQDQVPAISVPRRGPPRGGVAIPGLTLVTGWNAQDAEAEAHERSPSSSNILSTNPTSPLTKSDARAPTRQLPTPSDDGSARPPLPLGRPLSSLNLRTPDESNMSLVGAEAIQRQKSPKPQVPQGFSTPAARSREPSCVEHHFATAQDEEPIQAMHTLSPPPAPMSPPPRPPSKPPPIPGQSPAHRRQVSHSSIHSSTEQSGLPPTPSRVEPPTAAEPPTSQARVVSTGASGIRQSSRDLDLMPSSRWWRHGLNPLRLPPTIAGRPDVIFYTDTSSGTKDSKAAHDADIYLLFEDYSTTVISLSFQDDDAEESNTTLTQRYNFPPPKPNKQTLVQWSSSIGSAIAKVANDAAKQTSAAIGDGTPRAFVASVIDSVHPALPPVGSSYGCLFLIQVGPTVMEGGQDEVRPGDIVVCAGAELRGKRGLAPYHTTIGSQHEPTVGIVIEHENKKNKLRCIIQSTHNKKRLPDEVSIRLDDLKSGIIKIYRVPPRGGWVEDW